MGLLVTAHEVATLLPEHSPVGCPDEHVEAHVVAEEYESSASGLVLGRCYEVSGGECEVEAGSYVAYNEFRRALCQAAHGVDPEVMWDNARWWADQAFYELLHFADNDGTIGPKAAAALAKDFAEGRDKILPQISEWDRELYDEWAAAFVLAADSGIVVFG